MRGFHLFVHVISGVRGIEDTQCGFKLFTRRAARCLFPNQHIERWAFDVELLYLAARQFVPLHEVGVVRAALAHAQQLGQQRLVGGERG